MNIKQLLEGVRVKNVINEKPELDITEVFYDSREVTKGSLFVACMGWVVDGHEYIQMAIERGAKALVISKEMDLDTDLPVYLVEHSRESLAKIASNLYDHPSEKLVVTGITASNGKTSTSMMLDNILKSAHLETGLFGTVVYRIRDREIPANLTTPNSLELQKFFKELVDEKITHAVMEVSSIGIQMNRVDEVDFDVVAMNNVTREHIDEHGSYEKYLFEKSKLIKYAKKKTHVILNIADDYIRTLVDQTEGKVITFSDQSSADIMGVDIDISKGFGEFTVKVTREIETMKGTFKPCEFKVSLSVAGYHSVVNALSAIAMAIALGLDVDSIVKGLNTYRGIERRFQLIYNEDYKIVDDHFANAGNIQMSLQTLAGMTYNHAHILYAIRGNRGVTVNGENIDKLLEWSDRVPFETFIATKSVEIVTDHDRVSDEEEQIFTEKMKEAGLSYQMVENLGEALAEMLGHLEEGDVLLLAGCQGMDYGAKLLFEEMVRKDPSIDREKLFEVLEDRVAGV